MNPSPPSSSFRRFSLAAAFAILLVAASGPTCARADSLPNATEVAKQLGREVEFVDVVRGISRSRSKSGCYLSFGAPYPKQVLSVWVPDEVYAQLPRDPGLLGRKVQIKGRLEVSPTGPMLTLASPDQFDLLAVHDAFLAQSFLDGRKDREHFMAAVGQAFWREDFATLEALAKELQESRERFSDGTWILSAFFSALEVAQNEADERYAEVARKMELWRARYPASAAAPIAQAGYHLNLGSHVHGDESGSHSEDSHDRYVREGGVARQILEAHPAAKILPEYFQKMEVVALVEGWPPADFFRLFDEAVAREPDYYTTYFRAASYLQRERGGWERFAEAQRQRRGAGQGDVIYTRIAWSMSVNYRNLFESSAASWETMAAGFNRLMSQYPESRWIKNSYANFAFQARDRARLRPALAAIASNPDMGVWVNLENFAIAKRFADEEPANVREP
ncbi:MAG: hypothetical protein M3Q86_10060 [Verrucomicrobiota bacterium]|nr:hypothetical protein [Verrucomicrobiota bacterium]